MASNHVQHNVDVAKDLSLFHRLEYASGSRIRLLQRLGIAVDELGVQPTNVVSLIESNSFLLDCTYVDFDVHPLYLPRWSHEARDDEIMSVFFRSVMTPPHCDNRVARNHELKKGSVQFQETNTRKFETIIPL